MLVASLCTIPQRKETCRNVLKRILCEQTKPVDQLHVWLNGYATMPSDLLQDARIEYHLQPHNPGPWIRYIVADGLDDYDVLVTLDDDLDYPADYVERGVRELEAAHLGVVSFGGFRWDCFANEYEYLSDRYHFAFDEMLPCAEQVALLMGGVSTYRAGMVKGISSIVTRQFRTNDDMLVSMHLQQHRVRIQCCPKQEGWIRELATSQAEHALFRRDVAVRHKTFRQIVRQMEFDPTAGKLAEFRAKANRVLVTASICPPLAGSERLDEHLRTLCREGTGIHLIAPVPASQASIVQRYVDIPYHIHAVTVPEPGGRLDGVPPVRAWRDHRVESSKRRRMAARVKAAIGRLSPTSIYEWSETGVPQALKV